MSSLAVRISSHLARSAVIFILISLPAASHGAKVGSTVTLDHGLDLFEDSRYRDAEMALLDLLKSSTFKQLDRSQRSLVYSHIAYSKINRGKEKESLRYLDKALTQSKREFGERSLPYLDHLRTKAIALYWADDRREALRTGEKILNILERMNGDYRNEKQNIKHMIADMRKTNLEEGELPLDLSDFFSDCESIDSDIFLTNVNSIMNNYQLIGKDIRPNYKENQFFKNAYIKGARESSQDRKNRIVYVPDKDHMDDWCVIYPDKKRVDRAIISASNDR